MQLFPNVTIDHHNPCKIIVTFSSVGKCAVIQFCVIIIIDACLVNVLDYITSGLLWLQFYVVLQQVWDSYCFLYYSCPCVVYFKLICTPICIIFPELQCSFCKSFQINKL